MLLILLSSPGIKWLAGTYMTEELAQVQSGVKDLKSLRLRSYNTCLYKLTILAAIDVLYVIGTD